MEKGFVIVLILLALIHSVDAITVELIEPSSGFGTSSTSITFKCKTMEAADNLTLYHNISGWTAVETLTNINANTEYSFAVDNIPIGNYEWNCLANETGSFASENFTFRIKANAAPQLKKIIDNETWYQDDVKKIQLWEHFTDPDGDQITYSSSPINLTYINVAINTQGEVRLTPASNWTGTATITFTATDPYNNTNSSNPVTLRVKEKLIENRAPEIKSFSPENISAMNVGSSQIFTITKDDPDNDTLTVQWYVNSLPIGGANSDSYTFSPDKDGTYKIKVSVTDGNLLDSYRQTITVYNATMPVEEGLEPAEPFIKTEKEVEKCGNGKIDPRETCANCPEDAGCPEGYACLEEKCEYIKEAGSNLLMVIIVLSIFATAAILVVYFYRKRQEKVLFQPAKPIEKPAKKIKVEKKKPEKFLEGLPSKEEKPKAIKKEKTVSNVLLKNYVKTCLARGKTFAQIKQILLKVGWKEEQIDQAFEEIRKKKYKGLNERFKS